MFYININNLLDLDIKNCKKAMRFFTITKSQYTSSVHIDDYEYMVNIENKKIFTIPEYLNIDLKHINDNTIEKLKEIKELVNQEAPVAALKPVQNLEI